MLRNFRLDDQGLVVDFSVMVISSAVIFFLSQYPAHKYVTITVHTRDGPFWSLVFGGGFWAGFNCSCNNTVELGVGNGKGPRGCIS